MAGYMSAIVHLRLSHRLTAREVFIYVPIYSCEVLVKIYFASGMVKKMNKVIKLSSHVIALLGIVFLLTVSANKYSWMAEMDPTIVVEDPSGNRGIFIFIIMVIICLVELAVFKISKNKTEKSISLTFCAAAILIWLIKFVL